MTVNYHTHRSQLRKVFERILYLVVSAMMILVSQFSSAAQSSDEIGTGGATGIGFGAESNSNYLIQVISALILIVVILFALAAIVKKFNIVPGVSSGQMRIISGISLGGKDKLILVEIGDEQIVLGASPGRIQKIHTLAAPIATESPARLQGNAQSTFSSILSSFTKGERS